MPVGKQEWEVRVATSLDLIRWEFHATLLPNADMPYIKLLSPPTDDTAISTKKENSDWILLTHEQWMNPNSTSPSRLGFKLYRSIEHLLNASHADSFIVPLSLGNSSQLEGTPSIYDATITSIDEKSGIPSVNASVGFHYNNLQGVDQVAEGSLTGFGVAPINGSAPVWETEAELGYNRVFQQLGAVGSHCSEGFWTYFSTLTLTLRWVTLVRGILDIFLNPNPNPKVGNIGQRDSGHIPQP